MSIGSESTLGSVVQRVGSPTAMQQRIAALKRFAILKSLSEDVLSDLARSCLWQAYPREKHIFHVKDPSTDVYFITQGQVSVHIFSAVEGKQVLFTDLGPFEMFGEMAAIDGSLRSATVQAKEDCMLGVLSQDQFHRMISRHPAFALAVMKQLTSHVRRLTDRVHEFTLPVPDRVNAELLRQATPLEKNGEALVSAPREEFAARVHTTREGVSRALAPLEEAGIVSREQSSLRILSMDKLRKRVREAKGE